LIAVRTATPVANGANWWCLVLLGEFKAQLLNGVQRSVNRKVQSSTLCPGANFELKTPSDRQTVLDAYRNRTATTVTARLWWLVGPMNPNLRHLLTAEISLAAIRYSRRDPGTSGSDARDGEDALWVTSW
jgi:hypothetical protein